MAGMIFQRVRLADAQQVQFEKANYEAADENAPRQCIAKAHGESGMKKAYQLCWMFACCVSARSNGRNIPLGCENRGSIGALYTDRGF